MDKFPTSRQHTLTSIVISDYLFVVHGKNSVYLGNDKTSLPGEKEGSNDQLVFSDFSPHDWWERGDLEKLTEQHQMTKHIVKTNQGIPIPATLLHSIHSVGSTVSLYILIDNQLASGESDTDEVSHGDSFDCFLSSVSNVELAHMGTSLHDTHHTRCDDSLTIDSKKRGSDSTGRRGYFEVVRESTVLNLI